MLIIKVLFYLSTMIILLTSIVYYNDFNQHILLDISAIMAIIIFCGCGYIILSDNRKEK